MNIYFFGLHPNERKRIENEIDVDKLEFYEESINKVDSEKYKDCDVLCICTKSTITRDILDNCPNLKYIVTRSTGMDHIDLAACREKGIRVRNLKEYGARSVAEFEMGMMLDLTRKISEAKRTPEKNDFRKRELRGIDLYDKTLGIVGLGRIGGLVSNYAEAFGMNVLAYDKSTENISLNYSSLEEIIEDSDIISINVPLNNETRYMFNDEMFNNMKDGVLIINTSRGEVIDTDALIRALESGKVAGCALDVVEGEAAIKHNDTSTEDNIRNINNYKKLLEMPNVLITPHNAFNTEEAIDRLFEETITTINKIIIDSLDVE